MVALQHRPQVSKPIPAGVSVQCAPSQVASPCDTIASMSQPSETSELD
jgi:hypothetical protein